MRPTFQCAVRESFATGLPVVAEQKYTLRTTGEERYIRITSAKVGHEYVIDSMTDLTELKSVQDALAENEARFRRLLENAPDIVYRLALKPTIHYEYISPAASAVTGFTPEELMSDLTFAATRIFPEDRSEPPASLRRVARVRTAPTAAMDQDGRRGDLAGAPVRGRARCRRRAQRHRGDRAGGDL